MSITRRMIVLGAALTPALAACRLRVVEEHLDVQLVQPPPRPASKPKPVWGRPYSQRELDEAQRRFDVAFPPDLIELLRKHRIARDPDWTRDDAEIRKRMNWPFEGILFDVENNHLWWPEWGQRPETPQLRKKRLREVMDQAPKLIPLGGYDFPASPREAGNPLFHIVQSDIIYGAANLQEFSDYELQHLPPPQPGPRIKTIPFWSEMVERGGRSTRAEAERDLKAMEQFRQEIEAKAGVDGLP